VVRHPVHKLPGLRVKKLTGLRVQKVTRHHTPLLASAFTGAILLLGADVVIHALLGIELPVGIVTSIIGGLFLLYLLVQQNRKVQSA
ncbi:iron chelate uptake ABC transporter family permease subunit, partial [Corynebacterium sp. KPL2838]|uniref:iron chelate uptake ABC transporter family permease subunit n=1 Tax=Corynebacterium sp. KPL2838 TaxID=3158316 RepID=UPI0032EC8993